MSEDKVTLLTDNKELNENEKRALKYRYFFSQVAKNLLTDLKDGTKEESTIYRKYPKDKVVKMLEYPQRYERQIRELSCYLCLVSSNYRRLTEYYGSLLLYNYIIAPTQLSVNNNVQEIRKKYFKVINLCEKYNFKQEARKAITIAVRDGIYCGLVYEADNSFYIRQFNSNYTKVSSIEDGCYVFSIDLSYFTTREYLLIRYDEDIRSAYEVYKKDKKKNRYFEPKNGICIKADITDEYHSLPLFIGLFASIYDIEEYAVIQKIKSKNDIYKAVVMKMETDEYGVPKMDDDMSTLYYEQASNNIADNVGIIMSPFEVDSISFNQNSASDINAVTDAENDFWYKAGVSPLIFGSQKATSQGSLTLSVKPDEEISFGMLKQFERYFNLRLKKEKLPFKVDFLLQSIFNADEVSNRYHKAAQYGVDGAKLKYAASIDLTPSDVVGLSFLENEILEIGTKMFIHPLISSNTMSNGGLKDSNGESGRPTNESKGEGLSDEGEKTKEKQ